MAGGRHIRGNQNEQCHRHSYRCFHSLHRFLLTIEVCGRGLSWACLARGTTPQTGTTGSVYTSSTGQPVTWISQVGIFPVARQADFTVAPAFDSNPYPLGVATSSGANYLTRKKELRMQSN